MPTCAVHWDTDTLCQCLHTLGYFCSKCILDAPVVVGCIRLLIFNFCVLFYLRISTVHSTTCGKFKCGVLNMCAESLPPTSEVMWFFFPMCLLGLSHI